MSASHETLNNGGGHLKTFPTRSIFKQQSLRFLYDNLQHKHLHPPPSTTYRDGDSPFHTSGLTMHRI